MYQLEPATNKATNFIYLGNKLIARNGGIRRSSRRRKSMSP